METSISVQDNNTAELLEAVIIRGDLAKMAPAQRLDYYSQVCQSVGLNPLTKPFEYIVLNGKMTLYAKKDCADQLRRINGVSITKTDINTDGDYIVVTVYGQDKTGRSDVEIGVVSKKDMRGDYGNALMKAMTKAKRRLTLSLCGLGWLDETEVETIPDAKPVVVTDNGEIVTKPVTADDDDDVYIDYNTVCVTNGIVPDPPAPKSGTKKVDPKPVVKKVEKKEKPAFDETEFLTNWTSVPNCASMKYDTAFNELTSQKEKYGELESARLYHMLNIMMKKKGSAEGEQADEYQRKIACINEIFNHRKTELTIKNIDDEQIPFI